MPRPKKNEADRLEHLISALCLLPVDARAVRAFHERRLATTGCRVALADTVRWLVLRGLEGASR